MFKNYVLVAVRTLRRHLGYTMLNVVGLALGITCSLLLFLVIRHELSYDTFHSKADRTYRLNFTGSNENGNFYMTGTPMPLLEALRTSLPEFQPATHIFLQETGTFEVPSANAKEEPKRFREEKPTLFVEPEFFELFDFETNGVNVQQALRDPNSILLTESIAEKYFPNEEAVGKVVRMNNILQLKVAGVIPDAPTTTDVPFAMLVSYEALKKLHVFSDSWNNTNSSHQIYLALAPGASVQQTEKRIDEIVERYRPKRPGSTTHFVLQPLLDIHFNENYGNFSFRTVSKVTLWSLGLIGAFLVIVACINFINLATAQALRRAKEVGMRKVLGARRAQLVFQFLCETALITTIALLFSIVLAELFLPHLNQLLGLEITFSILQNTEVVLFLVFLLFLITFLAGYYPALVLSGFKPIAALKNKGAAAPSAGLALRRTLVVFQFTICQILIICTIVVHSQMEYFQSASLGFDKEAIVVMPLPSQKAKDLMALQPQLESHAAVKSVSFAFAPPSSENTMSMSINFDDFSKELGFSPNFKFADENYLELYQMPLLAGRMYEKSDTMREFVVNERFLRQVGVKSPEEAIGKKLRVHGFNVEGPVVGVVKDFHIGPLRNEIEPVIVTSAHSMYSSVSAKIEMRDAKAALAHLQQVWSTAYPNDVFYYEFLDDTIARFYESEQRQAHLFKIFSAIAILIGCLGLYGLVSFMVTQRTKEVGVRKVLGASSGSIVGLFSKDFAVLVLIAFLVAVPISYYFMDKWLQDFVYRIDISYWVFLAAGALTLLIALTTISVQALRAAFSNPVIALKTE